MYDYKLTESFKKDFEKLDVSFQIIIFKKIKYILSNDISRKHLKYGYPYFVLKLNISSRLVCMIKNGVLLYNLF